MLTKQEKMSGIGTYNHRICVCTCVVRQVRVNLNDDNFKNFQICHLQISYDDHHYCNNNVVAFVFFKKKNLNLHGSIV